LIDSAHLTPITRPSVADEVVERIVALILEQGLKPGHKLPSERELAARLSVGRSSLREAIRTLSTLGIVEVAIGEGLFVGRGQSAVLSRPLSWGVLMGERSTREIFEARQAVEERLAGFAAERATPAEIEAIGRCLEAMRASLNDADAYSRHDVEFHLAVSSAGHNQVLHNLLEALQQIMRVGIIEVFLAADDKIQEFVVHVPVYEAIRHGDARAARDAMAALLENAGRHLLAVPRRASGDAAREPIPSAAAASAVSGSTSAAPVPDAGPSHAVADPCQVLDSTMEQA